MTITSNMKKLINKPSLGIRQLYRLYYTHAGRWSYNYHGINIFNEDWDNLIILDACRYDIYADQTPFSGSLDSRISRGSATYEFVRSNFSDRQLHDVVYVTANSWFRKLREDINSEVYKLIDVQTMDLDDKFYIDELDGIVHPSAVTKYAKQAAENYPNKRLLIHYLRPHHPFIGPFGREKFPYVSSSLPEVLEKVGIDNPETIRKAYRENLDIVFDDVDKILTELIGKTVISADHGELLGERYPGTPIREFGHPSSIYCDTLVHVPWHIVDKGDGNRRKIIAEDPVNDAGTSDIEEVDKTLRALGYKI